MYQSAFVVYHSDKSAQLLEYQEYIKQIAQSFEWHKVYAYDKHFRHVQASNPLCPWNLVNQDAKDKHLIKGNKTVVESFKASSKGSTPKPE